MTRTAISSPDGVARVADLVREIAPPASVRALSTLASVDYADAFLLSLPPDTRRAPIEWARAMLEDAPTRFRATAPLVWFALGLKHGSPRSKRFVLGWRVRVANPGFALLGADSRLGMPAELLVRVERRELLFATLIRHENPMARAVWTGIAPMHREVVQGLLERVGRREWRAGSPVLRSPR